MDATYSTRFAANRAGARIFGADFELVPTPDKRFGIKALKRDERGVPTAKKAKAEVVPAPNKTRAAQQARAKKSKEPKVPSAAKGKRAQLIADAEAGKLPPVPDFTAETHTRFRPKLAEIVALVKEKDIKALKAFPINPISTSPKAMDRYRNLCVVALTAQLKAEARS